MSAGGPAGCGAGTLVPAQMGRPRAHAARRWHPWGFAWTSLCLALAVQAIEVGGTAATRAIGQATPGVPWLAAVGLAERTWLTMLTATTVTLLALSPLALRGERRLRPVAWAFAAVILADAAAHVIGSLVLWRRLPGVLSVPWLAATAVWLIRALRRSSRHA